MARKRKGRRAPKKKEAPTPRNERQEDILEIFVEAAHQLDGTYVELDSGPILSPGLIYCPQWHSDIGWYGPESQAELANDLARYNSSIEGGGLWDYNEDCEAIVEKVQKRVGRQDLDLVRKWVEANSTSIPNRELEAYVLYFEQNMSAANAAKRMGLANRQSFMNVITKLRQRISKVNTADPGIGPIIRRRLSKAQPT